MGALLQFPPFESARSPRDVTRPKSTLLSLDVKFGAKYRIFSNLIRTSFFFFADFLNEKKKLVRGSNPHLSFNRPLPTRQTDSAMSDDGESDQ